MHMAQLTPMATEIIGRLLSEAPSADVLSDASARMTEKNMSDDAVAEYYSDVRALAEAYRSWLAGRGGAARRARATAKSAWPTPS